MKQINTFVLPFIRMFTVSCNQSNELTESHQSLISLKEFQFINYTV